MEMKMSGKTVYHKKLCTSQVSVDFIRIYVAINSWVNKRSICRHTAFLCEDEKSRFFYWELTGNEWYNSFQNKACVDRCNYTSQDKIMEDNVNLMHWGDIHKDEFAKIQETFGTWDYYTIWSNNCREFCKKVLLHLEETYGNLENADAYNTQNCVRLLEIRSRLDWSIGIVLVVGLVLVGCLWESQWNSVLEMAPAFH